MRQQQQYLRRSAGAPHSGIFAPNFFQVCSLMCKSLRNLNLVSNFVVFQPKFDETYNNLHKLQKWVKNKLALYTCDNDNEMKAIEFSAILA